METNGIDRWAVAGEKLTADKKLTEDAKKVTQIIVTVIDFLQVILVPTGLETQ